MSTLVILTDELKQLFESRDSLDLVNEETGEVTCLDQEKSLVIQTQISFKITEHKDKVDTFSKYMKMLAAEIKITQDEIDNKKKEKDRLEKKYEYLDQCSKRAFEITGKTKFIGTYSEIKLTKSVQTIVEDPTIIPVEYQRTKTTIEPNKILIKEALISGKEIQGCVLRENVSVKYK